MEENNTNNDGDNIKQDICNSYLFFGCRAMKSHNKRAKGCPYICSENNSKSCFKSYDSTTQCC